MARSDWCFLFPAPHTEQQQQDGPDRITSPGNVFRLPLLLGYDGASPSLQGTLRGIVNSTLSTTHDTITITDEEKKKKKDSSRSSSNHNKPAENTGPRVTMQLLPNRLPRAVTLIAGAQHRSGLRGAQKATASAATGDATARHETYTLSINVTTSVALSSGAPLFNELLAVPSVTRLPLEENSSSSTNVLMLDVSEQFHLLPRPDESGEEIWGSTPSVNYCGKGTFRCIVHVFGQLTTASTAASHAASALADERFCLGLDIIGVVATATPSHRSSTTPNRHDHSLCAAVCAQEASAAQHCRAVSGFFATPTRNTCGRIAAPGTAASVRHEHSSASTSQRSSAANGDTASLFSSSSQHRAVDLLRQRRRMRFLQHPRQEPLQAMKIEHEKRRQQNQRPQEKQQQQPSTSKRRSRDVADDDTNNKERRRNGVDDHELNDEQTTDVEMEELRALLALSDAHSSTESKQQPRESAAAAAPSERTSEDDDDDDVTLLTDRYCMVPLAQLCARAPIHVALQRLSAAFPGAASATPVAFPPSPPSARSGAANVDARGLNVLPVDANSGDLLFLAPERQEQAKNE